MSWTTYDDAVSYNAEISYDGEETAAGGSGPIVFPRQLTQPTLLPEDDDALIAWFVAEEL